MKANRIESKAPYYKRTRYRVQMIVEFFRELKVHAADEAEAMALAEERVRARQANMKHNGYTVGDIEVFNIEEEIQ